MVRYFTAICLVVALALAPATAQKGPPALEITAIQLYQAEDLDKLLPDADALAAYIDKIKATLVDRFAAAKAQPGVSGTIFIALKPPDKRKIWILTPSNNLPPGFKADTEAGLLKHPPGMTLRGVFLVGLAFDAWGGGAKFPAGAAPPLPPEWEALIPPEGVMLNEAFFQSAWPN